jgi:putative ABC transport system permease protein
VVVLSDELWRKRYGANSAILNHSISIDNVAHTVVGVMPPGFFPGGTPPQLWTPFVFTVEEKNNRVAWGWTIIGRLKPHVSVDQAQTEMDLVGAQIEQSYPKYYQNMGTVLVPADDIKATVRTGGVGG